MLTLPASFPSTRLAAHTVAEHVVCAVRYAAVARIGMTPVEDGYVTPEFSRPENGTRAVGLRGGELVDVVDGVERRAPVTTVRGAAEFFGVPPGAPPLWTPTNPLELDAPLAIASDALAALARWFVLGAQALATYAPTAEQTLWPEHFDLAISLDGATYGVSPGDADVAEPYAYVGPPADPVPDGDRSFWNARFGAARSHDQIDTAADLVAFYAEARRRLLAIL
jgi:hypothetical protein